MKFSEIIAKILEIFAKKEEWYYDNALEFGNAVDKGTDKSYILKFVKSMKNLKKLTDSGFVIDYEEIAKYFCDHCIPFIIEAREAGESSDVRARIIGERNAWRKAFNQKITVGDELMPTCENKFLIYLQKLNHSFTGSQILSISVEINKNSIDVNDDSSWIYNSEYFPNDGAIKLPESR